MLSVAGDEGLVQPKLQLLPASVALRLAQVLHSMAKVHIAKNEPAEADFMGQRQAWAWTCMESSGIDCCRIDTAQQARDLTTKAQWPDGRRRLFESIYNCLVACMFRIGRLGA